MRLLYSFLLGVFLSFSSYAHDMTPTYPKLELSYMEGLLVTELEVFNKRNDVKYYEVGVFTKDWEPVPFVTSFKIFKLEYLERVRFSVYIRDVDKDRALYICSKSRTREEPGASTQISSTICSKIVKDDLWVD